MFAAINSVYYSPVLSIRTDLLSPFGPDVPGMQGRSDQNRGRDQKDNPRSKGCAQDSGDEQ